MKFQLIIPGVSIDQLKESLNDLWVQKKQTFSISETLTAKFSIAFGLNVVLTRDAKASTWHISNIIVYSMSHFGLTPKFNNDSIFVTNIKHFIYWISILGTSFLKSENKLLRNTIDGHMGTRRTCSMAKHRCLPSESIIYVWKSNG